MQEMSANVRYQFQPELFERGQRGNPRCTASLTIYRSMENTMLPVCQENFWPLSKCGVKRHRIEHALTPSESCGDSAVFECGVNLIILHEGPIELLLGFLRAEADRRSLGAKTGTPNAGDLRQQRKVPSMPYLAAHAEVEKAF